LVPRWDPACSSKSRVAPETGPRSVKVSHLGHPVDDDEAPLQISSNSDRPLSRCIEEEGTAAGACCSAVRPNSTVWARESHSRSPARECVARSAYPEQLNPLILKHMLLRGREPAGRSRARTGGGGLRRRGSRRVPQRVPTPPPLRHFLVGASTARPLLRAETVFLDVAVQNGGVVEGIR
jgi:hypothetical protein